MSVYVCFLPKRSAAFSLKITLAPQCNSTELRRTKLVAGLLYFGLSTPAPCLFWVSGHGCGNGGIYHPPGSAPNGLPTWVKLGSYWVGEQPGLRLVRANRGQSTNIFWFSSATWFYTSVDNHMYIWQPMTIIVASCDTESWPWKMNYGGIR